MSKKPVLVELETTAEMPSVADADPIPENENPAVTGAAMQAAARVGATSPSRLGRFVLWLVGVLLSAMLATALYDFIMNWIARQPLLGWALAGLVGLFCLALGGVIIREFAALRRLTCVDAINRAAQTALIENDFRGARETAVRVQTLYRGRPEIDWGRDRFDDLAQDQRDAESILSLAEVELLSPLDRLAQAEVAVSVRQVATVTALVPLALVDVLTALAANLRMIRRIAGLYGGRSGTLGTWRLTRAVMAHLVATGAISAGDDFLEPVLGGSLVGKLSRRFGEGLMNGALTARVGVAAIEVCRPLPFISEKRPAVGGLVKQAMSGLFSGSGRVPSKP